MNNIFEGVVEGIMADLPLICEKHNCRGTVGGKCQKCEVEEARAQGRAEGVEEAAEMIRVYLNENAPDLCFGEFYEAIRALSSPPPDTAPVDPVVCEWTFTGEFEEDLVTGCKHLWTISVPVHVTNCPYCSKPISVKQ